MQNAPFVGSLVVRPRKTAPVPPAPKLNLALLSPGEDGGGVLRADRAVARVYSPRVRLIRSLPDVELGVRDLVGQHLQHRSPLPDELGVLSNGATGCRPGHVGGERV